MIECQECIGERAALAQNAIDAVVFCMPHRIQALHRDTGYVYENISAY